MAFLGWGNVNEYLSIVDVQSLFPHPGFVTESRIAEDLLWHSERGKNVLALDGDVVIGTIPQFEDKNDVVQWGEETFAAFHAQVELGGRVLCHR